MTPSIYILCDHKLDSELVPLKEFLVQKGMKITHFSQKGFLKKYVRKSLIQNKSRKRKDVPPRAIIVYIHGKIHHSVEKELIKYCNNGGILIPLHHALASAKIQNPDWCEYVGVLMHKDKLKPFPWIVYGEGEFSLINLQPDEYSTSHGVKYDKTVEFLVRYKTITQENNIQIQNAFKDDSAKIYPAFTLYNTELFDNQILLPDPDRILLFGYHYQPKRIKSDHEPLKLEGIAGWKVKKKKGWLYYIQAGHLVTDFSHNLCQIVLNIINQP